MANTNNACITTFSLHRMFHMQQAVNATFCNAHSGTINSKLAQGAARVSVLYLWASFQL